jgi:hypothetical protein
MWDKYRKNINMLMFHRREDMFMGFTKGVTHVKMKKPRKERSWNYSREGHFLFMKIFWMGMDF